MDCPDILRSLYFWVNMTIMLEKEYEFYEKNKEEYRKLYLGKRVLIAGDEFIGAYDTDAEAYRIAVDGYKFKSGEFMIHIVKATDEDEVIKIYTPFFPKPPQAKVSAVNMATWKQI